MNCLDCNEKSLQVSHLQLVLLQVENEEFKTIDGQLPWEEDDLIPL